MVTVILSLTIGILCTLIIPVSWPKSIVCQPTRCFLWKAQKLHEACPAIGISCSPGWHLCDLGRCFDCNLTDLTCSLNAPEGPTNRPKLMKQKSTNDCQWAISAGDITSESLHVTISQAEMIRHVYLPTKPNKAQWTMVPCMQSKRAWEKSLYCSLFDNVWQLLYLNDFYAYWHIVLNCIY